MQKRKNWQPGKKYVHSDVRKAICNAHAFMSRRTENMLIKAYKQYMQRKPIFKVVKNANYKREEILADWDEPSYNEKMKDLLDRCYELDD